VLLVFIGSKIFVADALGVAKIPPSVSLSVTFAILASGIAYSLWKTRREAKPRRRRPSARIEARRSSGAGADRPPGSPEIAEPKGPCPSCPP